MECDGAAAPAHPQQPLRLPDVRRQAHLMENPQTHRTAAKPEHHMRMYAPAVLLVFGGIESSHATKKPNGIGAYVKALRESFKKIFRSDWKIFSAK
mgnify:CR=1 FL=1